MDNEDRIIQDDINRREYIRISTVFPIEFQLIDSNNKAISELVEAFTNDIGRGGMAITAKTLKGKGFDEFKLVPHETRLKVFINIPVQKEPIEAIAMVERVSHSSGVLLDECGFGISFEGFASFFFLPKSPNKPIKAPLFDLFS